MRAADDAVEIDTTSMSVDEVAQRVVELARGRGLSPAAGPGGAGP